PQHRQDQQHDDRALPANDQDNDGKKCNEQRNACPKVHGRFPVSPLSPAIFFLISAVCEKKSCTTEDGWRDQDARTCNLSEFRALLAVAPHYPSRLRGRLARAATKNRIRSAQSSSYNSAPIHANSCREIEECDPASRAGGIRTYCLAGSTARIRKSA